MRAAADTRAAAGTRTAAWADELQARVTRVVEIARQDSAAAIDELRENVAHTRTNLGLVPPSPPKMRKSTTSPANRQKLTVRRLRRTLRRRHKV